MYTKITSTLYCLIIAITISAQGPVINEVKVDLRGIQAEEVAERYLSVCDENYGMLYVDLYISSMDEGKMNGMDTKYVVSADMTAKIHNIFTEKLIKTKTIRLTGSGKSKMDANKRLIKSINKSRKKINKYLSEIQSVMTVDCSTLTKTATDYLHRKDYKKAMALATVTSDNCQSSQDQLRNKIYDAYQEDYCETHLSRVEAYLSVKEYDKAINEIVRISPDSKCGDAVNKITATIKEDYQGDYDDKYQAYIKYLELSAKERRDRRSLLDLLLVNDIIHD